MVILDTTVLAIAFDEHAAVPLDPVTMLPITQCRERIDYLLKTLTQNGQRVLIPTPVLCEYLVRGGKDKDKRLQLFNNNKAFSIVNFDQRAAIECALLEHGDSKRPRLTEDETKAKVKFDRQIIAIAIANGASRIYTGDKNLAGCAIRNGIETVMTWNLPLPPIPPQGSFDFNPPEYGTW